MSQLFIGCLVQNCSHGCQHARPRCVRSSEGPGDRVRNRHVHSFVVLRDVLLLGFPMFVLTVLARQTTACTIAPHMGHCFRKPVRCPSLLLLARKLCFRKTHSWSSEVPAQTQFLHSMMDNERRVKHSSTSGVGFWNRVNTPLVWIHNLEPTHFSSSHHPQIEHRSANKAHTARHEESEKQKQ